MRRSKCPGQIIEGVKRKTIVFHYISERKGKDLTQSYDINDRRFIVKVTHNVGTFSCRI